MALAALIVSIFATLLAGVGLVYTHRSTRVTLEADRRARTPVLTFTAEDTDEEGAVSVFYRVRNDGAEDLDTLVIHRPRHESQVIFPLCIPGQEWAADEISTGSLAIGQEVRFLFACGQASPWPDFRVRCIAHVGDDTWPSSHTLDEPRRGLGIY